MRWSHTVHYQTGEPDERTFQKGDAESVRYAEFIGEYRRERGLSQNITKIVNNETGEIAWKAHHPLCTAAHDPIKSNCTR